MIPIEEKIDVRKWPDRQEMSAELQQFFIAVGLRNLLTQAGHVQQRSITPQSPFYNLHKSKTSKTV